MLDTCQEAVEGSQSLQDSDLRETKGTPDTRAAKGPGRPRKKRKRDQALNIKCYTEEKAFLEKLASSHGVSLSRVSREIWGVVANDEGLINIVRTRLARVF